MKPFFIICLCLLFGHAQAGELNIPNTFTANTPARAAEVNANFSAAKTAVDDNDDRIVAHETRLDNIDAMLVSMQNTINSQPKSSKYHQFSTKSSKYHQFSTKIILKRLHGFDYLLRFKLSTNASNEQRSFEILVRVRLSIKRSGQDRSALPTRKIL